MSFGRRSSQPISWLGTEETKPNTTKGNNTGTNGEETKRKPKSKKATSKPTVTLTTARMCVHITVHNCRTQYSTEQF